MSGWREGALSGKAVGVEIRAHAIRARKPFGGEMLRELCEVFASFAVTLLTAKNTNSRDDPEYRFWKSARCNSHSAANTRPHIIKAMPEHKPTADERLQREFNRWAAEGEGAKMERHHLDITEKTLRLMDLRPGERVLDLGCGSGWATRLLARLVSDGPEGFGQVVGVDVSDEMIRQARSASKDFDNILYVWGSAHQIPWEENFFDKVLSVESFYYYPDQERALAELFRVMAPRGRMFILINLYADNPYSLQWVDKLKVPVHIRSEAQYVELLKKHAFENVEARRIPDDTPTPDDYQTKSFNSLEDLRAFKRIGALLLMASKPEVRNPAPGYTIY